MEGNLHMYVIAAIEISAEMQKEIPSGAEIWTFARYFGEDFSCLEHRLFIYSFGVPKPIGTCAIRTEHMQPIKYYEYLHFYLHMNAPQQVPIWIHSARFSEIDNGKR